MSATNSPLDELFALYGLALKAMRVVSGRNAEDAAEVLVWAASLVRDFAASGGSSGWSAQLEQTIQEIIEIKKTQIRQGAQA